MFDEPTVLILGAGASAPYGYPTGVQLKNIIIESLNNMVKSDTGWVNKLGFDTDLISLFISNFASSPRNSIDSFLAYQDNDEFTEIGKIAIVDIISRCENSTLSFCESTFDPNDDWYHYFASFLYDCPFEQINENIGIVTFNYDRSIESQLYYYLLPSYGGVSPEDCIPKLKEIPIYHLYGRLDPLPWESISGREYGKLLSEKELQKISKNIKLIQEAEESSITQKANDLLIESKNVYFLGLNLLNRSNLNLLSLNYLEKANVIGTTYNLTNGEKLQIKAYFEEKVHTYGTFPKINGYINLAHGNFKNLDTIRELNPF